MKKTAFLAKLLCLLLALSMLLVVMVACATEDEDVDSETSEEKGTDGTGGELATGTGEYEDGLSDLNFNTEIRAVASKDQSYQVFVLEESENVILNAVYQRTLNVEERLGLQIEWSAMDASWNNQREIFFQHIQTTCESGIAYDALCLYNLMPGALAAKGLCENLADTTYIDLEAPWWPEDFINEIVVNDQLYCLVENSSYGTLRNIHGVFFNNSLLDARNLRSPYDMVKANEWTFENMIALVKDQGSDLNNNGQQDKDDFFGVMTGTEAKIETWFYGMGYKYATKNAEGLPELLMNDVEYITSWLDTFATNTASNKDFWMWDKEGHTKMFFKESTILYMTAIRMVEHGASSEVKLDYGVVPVPKKDAAQEKYITNVANSHDMWCIPVNGKDLDASSAFVECMAVESYRYVAPIYFDQCVKLRYAPDERLSEMYDMIRDSIVFDFCVIYSFALPQVPRTLLHASAKNPSTTPWTSQWEKNGGPMESGFASILDLYQ
ncbi:MAG: hypothetical protein E7629_08460 [Ruminococcaceae bacterium]|nr:hypothetical protein [Oscillospiraceae bacterium]